MKQTNREILFSFALASSPSVGSDCNSGSYRMPTSDYEVACRHCGTSCSRGQTTADPRPRTSGSGWGQLTMAVVVMAAEVVAEEEIPDLHLTRRVMASQDADGEEPSISPI